MEAISVTNILLVGDAKANFLSPFVFDIFIDIKEKLERNLHWKIVYVGSAETSDYDQVQEEFIIDKLPKGEFSFRVETLPPDYTRIKYPDDLLASSVLMISATYRNQEFFRCSYFVFNSYDDPKLIENIPEIVYIDKICRYILIDKPRIKKTEITWDTVFVL